MLFRYLNGWVYCLLFGLSVCLDFCGLICSCVDLLVVLEWVSGFCAFGILGLLFLLASGFAKV